MALRKMIVAFEVTNPIRIFDKIQSQEELWLYFWFCHFEVAATPLMDDKILSPKFIKNC